MRFEWSSAEWRVNGPIHCRRDDPPWERPVIEMEKEPELYIIPARAGARAIYNTSKR